MIQREESALWEVMATAALASASFGPVAVSGAVELDSAQFVPPEVMRAYVREDERQAMLDTMWLPLGPDSFDGTNNGGRGFIPHQYPHRAPRHI